MARYDDELPRYTCPDIDARIAELENLRYTNTTLREIAKALMEKIEELEEQFAQAIRDLADMEQELDNLAEYKSSLF